jgi:hypothetical protein
MKIDVVERVRAYQEVFATDNGKIVLEDLKYAHHMMSSTYKKDLQDGELAFREGERNVVLRIVHILGQDLAKLKERATQNEKDSQ